MTDPGVYIGLDLGTSGLKGVALAASGTVVARGSAGYPTRRPSPGACEQDPSDWIAAAEAVLDQLREAVPARRWRGIGLTAMIPTLVTLGVNGEPTGPAITWQDSRADAHGDALRELCGGDALYRLTGQWLDGRYLLPMFLRVAAEEPARAAAATKLLAAKDFLFAWLTGEIATDPSTATGFGCYRLEGGGWDGDVFAAAESLLRPGAALTRPPAASPLPPPGSGSPSHAARLPSLPPILPSLTCRPLRGGTAALLGCEAIPVCLGAADSVLGAHGLGVRRPGQVAYIAGTSTVIIGLTDRLVTDPAHRFLVTPLAEPGLWGLEMDLLATGSAIRWLAGLLGSESGHEHSGEAALVALAADVDPADAPLALPYLSPGEQGALWDSTLHGAFLGLHLGHGARHLARGLINGIVLESRRCLAVLDATSDFSHELKAGGGSCADRSFRANLADATRRHVSMPGDHDGGYSARGAALLLARSITAEWLDGCQATASVAEPDEDRAARWDSIWADYERSRQAISPLYRSARSCPSWSSP